MKYYVRVDADNKIIETLNYTPEGFSPEITWLECLNYPEQQMLYDPRTQTAATPEEIQATINRVSPVEFKLLFTSAERVAIKAIKTTDPVVADFLDIIEDPRLTYVDLSLKSTMDALDYFTNIKILSKPDTEHPGVPDRKAEILAKQFK